jgi:hypothetical protein
MTRFLLAGVVATSLWLGWARGAASAQQLEPPAGEPAALEMGAELAELGQLSDYFHDGDVAAAEYLFQPGLTAPAAPALESPRPARRSARSEYVRLTRVPNMMGDSLGSSLQLAIQSTMPNGLLATTLPLAAGRSLKIGENNKALPMDRIYFIYNGFKNAIQTVQGPPFPPLGREQDLDRYTVGAEKTFLDGLASIDVRMPFTGSFQAGGPAAPLAVQSHNVGDLGMNLKGLMYADDQFSLAGGLGLTIPTAADAQWRIVNESFRLRNEAVHLLPWLGFLYAPGDLWFVQGFVQADFAASGFQLQQNGQFDGPVFTEQDLMYYDLLVGRWLYRNDYSRCLTGIAALLELHYTTSIEQAQVVGFARLPPLDPPFYLGAVGNQFNWIDPLYLSAGLHFQIRELSNLRVACVVPLKNRPGDRQFDAEILVSCNREF